MSFTSVTEFVKAVENTLGWLPDSGNKPLWKAYQIEASKIRRAMAKDPKITLANLAIALEYSRRKKLAVTSPFALIYRIDDALAFVDGRVFTDLEVEIERALAWEGENDLPDSTSWRTRLIRSIGNDRANTLQAWREARGLT